MIGAKTKSRMLFAVCLAAFILLLYRSPSWFVDWLSHKNIDELYKVLHWALGVVIVGVIIEEWKLIKGAAKFTRYSADGRFREALTRAVKHKDEIIEGVGFLILALGLSGELFIAPLIETSQKAELQKQSDKTAHVMKEAGDLGVNVTNLHAFVAEKETEISNQLSGFKSVADSEKKRADDMIASLTAKQKEVGATIEAAQAEETQLRTYADTIDELQKKLRDVTTKRLLTAKQIEQLKRAVVGFAKTKFDIAANHDFDSPGLAEQIGIALKAAGWDWGDRVDLGSVRLGDLPWIGSSYVTGLSVELCKSEEHSLAPPINALYSALKVAGYNLTHNVLEDSEAPKSNEPCGKIHMLVGSKF